MITLENLYFIGLLFTTIPWLIIFIKNVKARREIFIMSLVLGVASYMVAGYSYVDYWHPEYLIDGFYLEDFMYGFFVGGFSVGIGHTFFKFKRAHSNKNILFIFSSFIFTLFFIKISISYFQLNSIYSYLFVMFVIGLLASIIDMKKIKFQLITGLIVALYTIILYNLVSLLSPGFIYNYFDFTKVSGLIVVNTPLEEILFGFLLGYSVSVYYETAEGFSLSAKKLFVRK